MSFQQSVRRAENADATSGRVKGEGAARGVLQVRNYEFIIRIKCFTQYRIARLESVTVIHGFS